MPRDEEGSAAEFERMQRGETTWAEDANDGLDEQMGPTTTETIDEEEARRELERR